MHTLLKENDLISAEVQSFRMDGDVKLHTRNLKYGKLSNGICIKVDQSLIKQSSQHFINLDQYVSTKMTKEPSALESVSIGVDIILGNNGFIWITNTIKNEPLLRVIYEHKEKHLDYTPLLPKIDKSVRFNMVRVRNAIECLHQSHLHICEESIVDVYLSSIFFKFSCTDMLKSKQNMFQCVQNVLCFFLTYFVRSQFNFSLLLIFFFTLSFCLQKFKSASCCEEKPKVRNFWKKEWLFFIYLFIIILKKDLFGTLQCPLRKTSLCIQYESDGRGQ
ncbi:hypothetical protein RFI_27369 [Reticulomyxa filosa]|uniref:K Homology domain-containing protein n=1 Tax=Reticulomyxa filosa TaxID=46433 RepID=X6M955_RETFI|nr:hypothetical protein RFI_27369 [Reticulomyxa filosa]|eukprot:ETO10007.1 hypothetical protein RFI_27369 [Reticulomyxa filosa]